MKPLRYGISIDGRDGTYKFRREEIARRGFDALQLSAQEPSAVLARFDDDGTMHVLAERHFDQDKGPRG